MCIDRIREFKIAMKDLTGKKVLVVGLGKSGVAVSRLLIEKGAIVWVTEKGIISHCQLEKLGIDGIFSLESGRHTEGFVKGKDLVVVSPGVAPTSEVMGWAKKYNIPIISEIELASWFVRCPLVCVTGTNGKSTVTGLIDHILRCAGKSSVACGNIGLPLSEVVLKYKRLDFCIVEVSSFQLEYIMDFKPKVSVWLNFSYDHLDRYPSMDAYLKAKLRIFENQTEDDWAIINRTELDRVGNIRAKKIVYDGANEDAAVTTAKLLGIDEDVIMYAVKNFKPLPHRMQYVDTIDGVDFIDDSKATNVHAVIYALNHFERPIVLILGGRDKGDDFNRLKDLLREKVMCVVVFGEAKEKIISQLEGVVPIYSTETLEDSVDVAFSNASTGTKVLLSPGCSSFDMFRDYKERGERFQDLVHRMKGMCIHEK